MSCDAYLAPPKLRSSDLPFNHHENQRCLGSPADYDETLYWDPPSRWARLQSLVPQVPYSAWSRRCRMLSLRTRAPPMVSPVRAAGGILFRWNEGHKGSKSIECRVMQNISQSWDHTPIIGVTDGVLTTTGETRNQVPLDTLCNGRRGR